MCCTSTSSALGYFCEGWGDAPTLPPSWPAGELPWFPSPSPGRRVAGCRSWPSPHPSFWREQEVQRKWTWPQNHLRDANDNKCTCIKGPASRICPSNYFKSVSQEQSLKMYWFNQTLHHPNAKSTNWLWRPCCSWLMKYLFRQTIDDLWWWSYL